MKNLTQQEKEVASVSLTGVFPGTIAKIVEEESQLIEGEEKISATPKFVASLVELVNKDLNINNSRHAKRKTITPEDMFMVTRRNEDLTGLLKEHLVELNANKKKQTVQYDNNNAQEDDDDDDFDMDDELIRATTNRKSNR
ncbi:hypothetical protein BN7_2280 [Wickerhamomyces ciferrii]|uniref:Uncharacterized protein n=1 Tax=Wickerhamomyces ciferrii (strain ATCC 14091 / BCRC 22168 / CBS 111 / JCM 3599 / NBRC 0793 / NRRL Y-1031 F-60-10) TaxID=1206466 RepID=K0KIB3_WICCF|nr:uncharacterized protein BN7_2280 [Wickerhamomyces ciferrii]CCH42736.1 hypothetical protein BN7_2280 [Wickerhamomyces ciferrii]